MNVNNSNKIINLDNENQELDELKEPNQKIPTTLSAQTNELNSNPSETNELNSNPSKNYENNDIISTNEISIELNEFENLNSINGEVIIENQDLNQQNTSKNDVIRVSLDSNDSTNKYSQENQNDSIKGYLKKLGQVNKSLKRRYFVLINSSLSYFPNSQSTRPIQTIQLKLAHVQETNKFSPETSFELVTGSRVYYFVADTVESKNMWMKELSNVCKGRDRWLDQMLVLEDRIRKSKISNWRTNEEWAKNLVMRKLERMEVKDLLSSFDNSHSSIQNTSDSINIGVDRVDQEQSEEI